MRRPYIDFMGNRKWLFLASGLILAVGVAALLTRHLQFGIEFRGGTVLTFTNAKSVTMGKMRDALREAGVREPVVQTTAVQGGEGSEGFIVRTSEADSEKMQAAFQQVSKRLGLDPADGNVQTISPDWGEAVTNAALLALALSIAAILLYISIRFEYKMSVTAIVALAHDILLTLGVYALVGREVTPNTIAALLTILGYSLYDTIVVFHRIRENSQHIAKQTFMRMANDSINQVLARSINTSLTSVIPVLALLLFGGETLKDFAFALFVGMLSGTYSSVAVASPLYAVWKEREPRYRALAKRFGS